jgi:hypothetical protein
MSVPDWPVSFSGGACTVAHFREAKFDKGVNIG